MRHICARIPNKGVFATFLSTLGFCFQKYAKRKQNPRVQVFCASTRNTSLFPKAGIQLYVAEVATLQSIELDRLTKKIELIQHGRKHRQCDETLSVIATGTGASLRHQMATQLVVRLSLALNPNLPSRGSEKGVINHLKGGRFPTGSV